MTEERQNIDERIVKMFTILYNLEQEDVDEVRQNLLMMSEEEKDKIENLFQQRYKKFINDSRKLISDLKLVENDIEEAKEKQNVDDIIDKIE